MMLTTVEPLHFVPIVCEYFPSRVFEYVHSEILNSRNHESTVWSYLLNERGHWYLGSFRCAWEEVCRVFKPIVVFSFVLLELWFLHEISILDLWSCTSGPRRQARMEEGYKNTDTYRWLDIERYVLMYSDRLKELLEMNTRPNVPSQDSAGKPKKLYANVSAQLLTRKKNLKPPCTDTYGTQTWVLRRTFD